MTEEQRYQEAYKIIKKLGTLGDPIVEQIVYDALHLKHKEAYKRAGMNVPDTIDQMQHYQYEEIYEELKTRYKNQLIKIQNGNSKEV